MHIDACTYHTACICYYNVLHVAIPSGIARNFFEGLPKNRNSAREARAQIFSRPRPLIATTRAMALDLAAKTGFYRL